MDKNELHLRLDFRRDMGIKTPVGKDQTYHA